MALTFKDTIKATKELDKKRPKLKLTGEDGNAFFILGKAKRVARKNNMNWDEIKAEATSGNYDHLLQTMMKYFEVE
jgi:hypothetical protein